MKKFTFAVFLLASSLAAQVQLGRNVQIGGAGSGGGCVLTGVPGHSVIFSPDGTTCAGDAKFTFNPAYSTGRVNINGGAFLEIDGVDNTNNTFLTGDQITLTNHGESADQTAIAAHIDETTYTGVGSGVLGFDSVFELDKIGHSGTGFLTEPSVGNIAVNTIIGYQAGSPNLGTGSVAKYYGFLAAGAGLSATTEETSFYAVASATSSGIHANYCDFKGGASDGVRESIGCGPTKTSTFGGPVNVDDGTGAAGIVALKQGTARSTVTSSVGIAAPTAVTAYNVYLPGAQGTGALTNDGSGNLSWSASGANSSLPPLVAQPTPASATFLQALNNVANTATSSLMLGDSFLICDHTLCGTGGGPVTATNRWPEQVRIHGQALYGSHGTGVVPIVYTFAASPSPVNPEAYSTTGTYDTSTVSLGPTQSSQGTLVHLATGATITFNDARSIAWDTLHVIGATTSGSGSLSCAIDGGSPTVLTTGSAAASGAVNGGFTARRWDFAATTLATHSVVCTATGDFYVFAFHGTAGATGFEVSNVGIGGATAGAFGASAANQMAFYDLIFGGVQATVIMDQTNDAASSVSTGTFSTNLQNVISHQQALSSLPTVILAIPPVDVIDGTHALAPYTAIQTGLCTSLSLTCINVQNRGTTVGATPTGWGTTYISSALWDLTGSAWPGGNAGVHPSDKGALDVAQMIYATLVNPTATPTTQTYPGAGIANSTGSAWGTSYTTTGSGTVVALATSPTLVTPNIGVATGTSIALSGNSTNSINTGSQSLALTVTSSHAAGTTVEILGSGTNIDTWGIQSGVGSGALAGNSQLQIGNFTAGIYGWAQHVTGTGTGYNEFPSLSVLGWSSTASVTANAADTGLSRDSAGVVDVGNGTQGNISGTIKAAVGTFGTSATVAGNTVAVTVASGTSALGTSAIASGACATVVTTAATGVATTDVVPWGFNADPTATTGYAPSASGMLTIIAYPGPNAVNFKVCNNTSASVTPGAVTLNWRVGR